MSNWKVRYWYYKILWYSLWPVWIFMKPSARVNVLVNLIWNDNFKLGGVLAIIFTFETANFTSQMWCQYFNPVGMGIPSGTTTTRLQATANGDGNRTMSTYASAFDGIYDTWLWLNVRMSVKTLSDLTDAANNPVTLLYPSPYAWFIHNWFMYGLSTSDEKAYYSNIYAIYSKDWNFPQKNYIACAYVVGIFQIILLIFCFRFFFKKVKKKSNKGVKKHGFV